MPDAIRWSAESFPGRPAFDVAVSRALLRDVAHGRAPETLRLYRPDDVVAFSTTDLRRPGFPDAVRAAHRVGFGAALRLAGGSAAVFHRETLAFAWCMPESEARDGIRRRFERTAGWIADALRSLGVDARIGAVPGEYCPGDWSVNAGGRLKLMGVGQRVVRGAAHVGGVIVVRDAARARAALEPVHAALEIDYDPATTGAVEDAAPGATLDRVRQALVAALGREREVVEAPLPAATIEGAATFEGSHRLGPEGEAS